MSAHVPERIEVETPGGEALRDRVERQVFDALDAQLAGTSQVWIPSRRPRRVTWLAGGCVAVAAAACLLVLRPAGPNTAESGAAAPSSIVVTPPGGRSRLDLGDAIVDFGSDTRVEIRRAEAGATVTLALARGSVDCDVAPRPGRPVFRVLAGNVTVEVVGTRFSVAYGRDVRVDVTRGTVRVSAPASTHLVAAGGTWSSAADPAPAAAAGLPAAVGDRPSLHAPDVQPGARAPVDPHGAAAGGSNLPATAPGTEAARPAGRLAARSVTGGARSSGPRGHGSEEARAPVDGAPRREARNRPVSPKATFAEAQALEGRDPDRARELYRTLAAGSDVWAALGLYSLAELEQDSGKNRDALSAVNEYERRFPYGAHAEDVAWLRVHVLQAARRSAAAREAAEDYLRRYPTGAYVEPARRFAQAAPPRP